MFLRCLGQVASTSFFTLHSPMVQQITQRVLQMLRKTEQISVKKSQSWAQSSPKFWGRKASCRKGFQVLKCIHTIHAYIYIYTHLYYIYMYMYKEVYTCIYMYICICTSLCIHTNTEKVRPPCIFLPNPSYTHVLEEGRLANTRTPRH